MRPRLVRLAYGLLGDLAESEDVVQDAWLRLNRAEEQPEDVEGWLVVTVSRLALDVLKSARKRREEYVGPWLPEPIVDADPADRVTLDESLSLAMFVVLETPQPGRTHRLRPARRLRRPLRRGGPSRRADPGRLPAARQPGAQARPGEGSEVRRRRGRSQAGRRRVRGGLRGEGPRRACWPCSIPMWSCAVTGAGSSGRRCGRSWGRQGRAVPDRDPGGRLPGGHGQRAAGAGP